MSSPDRRHAAPPDDASRVRELLAWASARIRAELADSDPAGSADTPYLDAMVLLATARGETTERLMASMPDPVDRAARDRFVGFVTQRCSGVPVSYIRGTKEFFGREFIVSPSVLVPRPETEQLVELALEIADTITREHASCEPIHVHDCCTGSGCVALTVAAERPSLLVTASDISEAALEVAAANGRVIAPDVAFHRSDLLETVSRNDSAIAPRPRIITANPPYLTDTEYERMRAAEWPEPPEALRAGPDGLDLIRRLAGEAVTILPRVGYLIVEIGRDQGEAGCSILREAGFSSAVVHQDLGARDRVLIGITG
ncbi:MAG: peptide chain release factor N(5)-glutamine methyltransferase [Spirochaetota bacterium]